MADVSGPVALVRGVVDVRGGLTRGVVARSVVARGAFGRGAAARVGLRAGDDPFVAPAPAPSLFEVDPLEFDVLGLDASAVSLEEELTAEVERDELDRVELERAGAPFGRAGARFAAGLVVTGAGASDASVIGNDGLSEEDSA